MLRVSDLKMDRYKPFHRYWIGDWNGTKMASFLSNHKSYPYITFNPWIDLHSDGWTYGPVDTV